MGRTIDQFRVVIEYQGCCDEGEEGYEYGKSWEIDTSDDINQYREITTEEKTKTNPSPLTASSSP